ncbi:MAG: FecR domain-containing protein [Spirochaetales bacterium]|nr:FecR domain-containing protein [Spirochaetales bacterium]
MKIACSFSLSLILIAFLVLPGCGQGDRQSSSSMGRAEAVSVGANIGDRALVLCTTGSVSVNRTGEWTSIAAGDFLRGDQSVKTGARSSCELQFGRRAAVRIEENTEVRLDSLSLAEGGTDIGLRQASGMILCKVDKLAGSERFRVKTKTAACGVKGTEFAVSVSDEFDTLLTVRLGVVSIAPAALDLEKLSESLRVKDMETDLAELGQVGRLVEAGRAAKVSAAAEAAAEKSMAAVEKEVETVSAAQPDAAARKRLKAAVHKAKTELSRLVAAPRPQTDAERTLLERIDELSKRFSDAVPADEEEKRYRISLQAKPEDAEIYLAGESVGYGRFQGLFPEGDKLEFTVSRIGFMTRSLSVEVGKDAGGVLSVDLEREWAETGTAIAKSEKGTIATKDAQGRGVAVTLGPQETLLARGGLGFEYFPNATVTLLGRNPYRLLLPVWGDTYLLEGTDLSHWTKSVPVLTKGGKGSFDNFSAYIDGVYRHTDGRLYGFYHAYDGENFEGEPRIESEPGAFWYGRIAVAVSDDNGATWEKKGLVIESCKSKSWSTYPGQTTRGVADLALVRDKNGRYLYIYYAEFSRVNGDQVHICMARADIRERPPLPGSFKKYYRGGFTEEGLGGLDSAVVDSKYMNLADTQESHVFYSKAIGSYVMIYALSFWQENDGNNGPKHSGFYLAYSDDGIGWSRGFRLTENYTYSLDGKEFAWYPSVILDSGSTADGWLVYGYSQDAGALEKNHIPFYMVGRRISFRRK